MHSNGKNTSGMNRSDLPGLKYTLGTSNHIMGGPPREGYVAINLLVLEKKVSHYTLTMLLVDTRAW